MNSSSSHPVTVLPGSSQRDHDKVLPPLTPHYPRWSRGGKIGSGGIYQKHVSGEREQDSVQKYSRDRMVNKKGPELAAVGRSEGLVVTPSSDPLLRIAQLEQNIKFLQEQHQLMLTSLHQEVEQLRHKNRDLQFQLVFSKAGGSLQSSPSSPEDDSKPKIILSPKQVNVTPLQIELLEKEIAELKGALHEARTKNIYLSGIVEEQRKKLESLECGRPEPDTMGYKTIMTTPQSHGSGHMADERGDSSDCDLASKLEEAEQLIRRLRRDNEENRRELVTIKTNLSKNVGGAGGNRPLGAGGGNNGHRGGGGGSNGGGNNHHRPHSQQSQTQRFPPLHSQSYWHHGQHSQHRTGIEFVSHRHCANGRGGNNGMGNGGRIEKDTQVVGRPAPSLPNLRNNTSNHYTFINGNGNNNGHNHRRGGGHYNGNSNHYYRGAKGGGRGMREPREPRESRESREPREPREPRESRELRESREPK